MTGHTPGPWGLLPCSHGGLIVTRGNGLEHPQSHVQIVPAEDARLFAAVPDMLKALGAASAALKSYQHGNSATDLAAEVAAHCDGVIAKATGAKGETTHG